MAAREVTALRSAGSPSNSGHNSPTAAGLLASGGSREFAEMLLAGGSGGGGLVRQDSMNLPKPEDSNAPATHPDMCIVRIRRQHLLEVLLFSSPFLLSCREICMPQVITLLETSGITR